MKISQVCAVILLLALGSMMVFADSINDPKIVIHGVSGTSSAPLNCGPHGCQDVGVNFTFSVPKSGNGTLFFTNTSGHAWTSLTLIEAKQPNQVPAADVSCIQTEFLSCTVKTLKNGSVEILLSGVNHSALNPRTGIANGASFDIRFACVSNSCWPGGLEFSGHAGTVPEPGTVALMITGLGGMFSRRKQWLSRLRA